jgi:hypothetical protein
MVFAENGYVSQLFESHGLSNMGLDIIHYPVDTGNILPAIVVVLLHHTNIPD